MNAPFLGTGASSCWMRAFEHSGAEQDQLIQSTLNVSRVFFNGSKLVAYSYEQFSYCLLVYSLLNFSPHGLNINCNVHLAKQTWTLESLNGHEKQIQIKISFIGQRFLYLFDILNVKEARSISKFKNKNEIR